MAICEQCFHQPVCFLRRIRKKIIPQGFDMECTHFKNEADIQEVKRVKRIPMEMLHDKFKCPECGNKDIVYKDKYCSECGAKFDDADNVRKE